MNCMDYRHYAAYLDGELAAPGPGQVEAHLAACPACAGVVELLRAENETIRQALAEETLEQSVAARTGLRGPFAFAAALAVAFGAGAELVLQWQPPRGMEWLNPLGAAAWLSLLFNGTIKLIEEGIPMFQTLVVAAGSLVLGLAVLSAGIALSRKRVSAVTLAACLLVLVAAPRPAEAAEMRTSKQAVVVPSGETLDDTLIAVGETVMIEGTVTGDVIAAARRVVVRGTVLGNLVAAAQQVEVEGIVEGTVFSFGQDLFLRGRTGSNFFGLGQTVTVTRDGRVEGNVMALAQEGRVDGTVLRDFMGIGQTVAVLGSIGRNMHGMAERVSIGPGAGIGGDLHARVPRTEMLTVDPDATVAGATDIRLAPARRSRYARPGFYLWQAIWLAGAFLIGLILHRLFPTVFGVRLDSAGSLLRATGVGFLAFVATPIAALLACITLIGLPIGLLAFALWLTGLYLAKIVVAVIIGRMLLARDIARLSAFAPALLLGLGILFVAMNLPYAGGVLRLLTALLGLGVLVMHLIRSRRESSALPESLS